MTVLTGKRDSKIQDGEDVDILRSSGWGPNSMLVANVVEEIC